MKYEQESQPGPRGSCGCRRHQRGAGPVGSSQGWILFNPSRASSWPLGRARSRTASWAVPPRTGPLSRAGLGWSGWMDGCSGRGRASGHALDLTSSLRGIPSVPLWRCREARLDARFADGDTLDAFGAHSDSSYTYSPLVQPGFSFPCLPAKARDAPAAVRSCRRGMPCSIDAVQRAPGRAQTVARPLGQAAAARPCQQRLSISDTHRSLSWTRCACLLAVRAR